MLRSVADAAAPVKLRMWVEEVRDQLRMTYKERRSPPRASNHQIRKKEPARGKRMLKLLNTTSVRASWARACTLELRISRHQK